ncbi:MAG: deoxyribonuclease IV, partial [Armatimonadota bacterium]
RAAMLGGDMVVTHMGSHKGSGSELGLRRVAESLRFALDAHDSVTVALELGAGGGSSVGSRFDEVARIIDYLAGHPRVGIAIDTAHLYAAGYDVSNSEGVNAMFAELDRLVGVERLKLIHLNDTPALLGSHRDRHHHIGRGRIGREGFRAIVNHPASRGLPGIIETPAEHGWDARNLRVLRRLVS